MHRVALRRCTSSLVPLILHITLMLLILLFARVLGALLLKLPLLVFAVSLEIGLLNLLSYANTLHAVSGQLLLVLL